MTDQLSGRALVEKAFSYMTTIAKELRKFLTSQFETKYKGIAFNRIEATIKEETESWFARRDKNMIVKHDKTVMGRPGELTVTYSGTTKDARFKFHVNGIFTTSGSTDDAPSYLKSMNANIDKREFSR